MAASEHPCKKLPKRLVNELVEVKSFYGRLWKIHLLINERYNWSVFALIGSSFISATRGLYWVFNHIIMQQSVAATREINDFFLQITDSK